jgi:hypothetical protein
MSWSANLRTRRNDLLHSKSESEGQRRMTALHGGRLDKLEIYPNQLGRPVRGGGHLCHEGSPTRSTSTTRSGSTTSSCLAIRT